MNLHIKVKSPNNISKWQMEFNLAFKGLICRTNLTKNNGLNMGKILYNKLPEELKKVEHKYRFKSKVKKYLLQNVFYSVNEYLST
jgi:hypothetical protein